MPVEIADPVIEPGDIVEQPAHLGLNDSGLFTHMHVPQNGANGVERRHQRGGGNQVDAFFETVLKRFRQVSVKLGINRL